MNSISNLEYLKLWFKANGTTEYYKMIRQLRKSLKLSRDQYLKLDTKNFKKWRKRKYGKESSNRHIG
jgi:predicted metalloprotease with PDZ domain